MSHVHGAKGGRVVVDQAFDVQPALALLNGLDVLDRRVGFDNASASFVQLGGLALGALGEHCAGDVARDASPAEVIEHHLAAQLAGVEGVGVHALRHSAAVAWLESGVHIKAVADLLGNSSISVTGDVYGLTSDDAARAAIDGLTGALGL